jgi:hypothetical protein
MPILSINRILLKEYKIDCNHLKQSSERKRKKFQKFISFRELSRILNLLFQGNNRLGKFSLIALLLLMGNCVAAPETNMLLLTGSPVIRPFAGLMYATAMVETLGNPMAYNIKENAVGIFQIRQVRIDEYNRLTGSQYVLNDMFSCSNSEKVFLYFASQEGPYRLEKIAKAWNGSGPMTEIYWKRIQKYL